MSDPNPYEPPEHLSVKPEQNKSPSKRSKGILQLLLPAVVFGALLGAVFLAPLVRGPGDPEGHNAGFALGGFAGLFAGILVRLISSSE
ncbi:MAG: chloride channel protein [Planctomycetes bacterium]|nr:chloride channel protein [Planctomycetota bacterium]